MLSFWSFCGGGGGFVFVFFILSVLMRLRSLFSLSVKSPQPPLNCLFLLCVSFLYKEFIHFPADYWLYLSHFAYMKRPFFSSFFYRLFSFLLCFWACVSVCEYVSIFIVASKWTRSKKTLFVVYFRNKIGVTHCFLFVVIFHWHWGKL